jgi:hypothetical protein
VNTQPEVEVPCITPPTPQSGIHEPRVPIFEEEQDEGAVVRHPASPHPLGRRDGQQRRWPHEEV